MSRRNAMAGGGRRGYTLAAFGSDEGRGYRGNHFCDEALVDPWKLAWTSKRSPYGVTTLRILPNFNPENPEELDPYVLPDGNPGDFARCYWTWRAGGDPSATFILFDPVEDQHYDMDANPAIRVYNAVRNVLRDDEHHPWATHVKGGNNRGALLVPPKKCWFVQALIYEHGTNVYDTPKGAADDDKVCIVDLGKDAGSAMFRTMQKENDQWDGEPDDADARFQIGNPIDLESQSASFFRFYPLEAGAPSERERRQQRRAPASGGTLGGRRSGGGLQAEERTQIGFGVEMVEEFNGMSAVFGEEDIDFLMDKIKPWDEVLKFPTDDEQAALLASRLPYDVLEYAWRDRPEWLPDRDSANAREARGATSAGFGRRGTAADAATGDDAPRSSRRSRRAAPSEDPVTADDRFADDDQALGGEEEAAPRTSRRTRRNATPEAEAPATGGRRRGGRGSARSQPAGQQDAAVPDDVPPDDEYDDYQEPDTSAVSGGRRTSARQGLAAARNRQSDDAAPAASTRRRSRR